MDYNLQGLSPRSFEQLIQSMAAKIIGPQVIIFGDGPDGGREATFEGAIPYPSLDSGWVGYGIVQAKFKQRPQSAKEDGTWAVQQLRSELKAFLNPKKRKRKPEYYIFATNVILTPVEEKGAKDQCIALLEEFATQFPLKEYDIWDYDKLRVFLDDNEEIRRGYSAWITSGDVLSEVIKWFEASTPNFEETLTTFLEKELLSDQYVNLEQAGHSGKDGTAIARVFVDLPAFEQNLSDPPLEKPGAGVLPPGIVAQIIASANERLDPQSLGVVAAADSVARSTSINRTGRYVITGGPGQGKTTIGQFVCQLFRASILKDKPNWRLDPETRHILNTISSQIDREGLPLPTARRFPIRVVLSQFAKALAAKDQEKTNSVLSYVVDLIRKRTDQAVSADDFKRWLGKYPWLIVFDGLDEVPASTNRDAVLAAIRDFRVDARSANADVLTIGTTRPQGYNEDFSPDLHQHVWLAPLSTFRAMHYAERLVEVRYGNDKDRVQKILNRLSRASKNEATARLMRSPLQVTIMATLVDRMGQPPQERWNLFKQYYKVIYQREVERDIPAATVLRDYQPNVDTIHNHVGLLLQLESERSGQTDARLTQDQFEAVVDSRLKEEGYAGDELDSLKRQIIEAATDRLVFLVGLQADKVGFEIRSLQEFMAAEGLMNGTDELVRKRLREIAPISNWRNVFLFAAGKCFAERQHLRDTIHLICAELNEDPTDRPLIETLAGSRLALDLLEDGPARRQPKYAQSLARIALRLMEQPPENDHIRLAGLYEAGLDTVYQQELRLRISHFDHNRRLGAWATLIPLIEKNLEWARSIAESHWPNEVTRQFDILLAGAPSTGEWFRSKLETVIPNVSPIILEDTLPGKFLTSLTNYEAPDWLKAINKLLSVEEFHEAQWGAELNEPGAEEILSIQFLRVSENNWMLLLRDIPTPSSEWRGLIAGVEFAYSPSVESLLSALQTVLDNSNDKLKHWLISKLPWPLASALAFSGNVTPSELKKLAAEGQLGDPGTWSDAEDRWLRAGFDVDDILYTGKRLPFDKKVANSGFPFSSDMSVTINEDLSSVVPVLLEIHKELLNSPLRPWVAGWILFVLSAAHRHNLLPENESPLSLQDLRELITESTFVRERIYLDGICLIDLGNALSPDAIEFFDWLGNQDVEVFIDNQKNDRMANLLTSALKVNPEKIGLLRALSWWITQDTEVHVPTALLDCDKYSKNSLKEAALIINLTQGGWKPESISCLTQWSADFIGNREVSKSLFESSFLPPNVSWTLFTRLLVELRASLPSSQWDQDAKLIQRLNESISRRTSRLGTNAVWMEMGMPQGLTSFLAPQGEETG